MGRFGRWAALAVAAWMLLSWPLACSEQHIPPPPRPDAPIVRVRLLAARDEVKLRATTAPTIKAESETAPLKLNLPDEQVSLRLLDSRWRIGNATVPGEGELTIWQGDEASVYIDGNAYRGRFRCVPTGGDTFDVVNDVDVESYLKSVVPRELLHGWDEETYKAQAIIARTYALFQAKTGGTRRHFDLYPDQRSQVYGGVDDESAKARLAVDETSGIVVAYGEPGSERIFKAYFSACCGGVSQSAADAFNEPFLVPLCDQNVHGLCAAAPKFNWGPVEISKDDLTRRLREFGKRRGRGEQNMARLAKLEILQTSRFDRPIAFVAYDDNGNQYSLRGEELRNAINGSATPEQPQRLYSSFVKVINEPGSDIIRFVDGHGNGHGVGMCQWCSQIRAEAGMRHEDIVLSAFPRAKLIRAY
jgi:stage II sporulation protein D